MLKRLKCPNCYSQARQIKSEDGLVTCGKCSSTYFEDSNVTIKAEEAAFSDLSDNEPASFFSDNYVPSANEEGSDVEDFLKNSTQNMFDDSDQEEPTTIQRPASKKAKTSNMFDDIDSSSDEEEEIEPIQKKGKAKSTKDDKEKKLPAIFSDKLIPTEYKSTAKLDGAFSDMEDDYTLTENKQLVVSRKRPYTEDSSDSSSDSEAPLQVFDPKRNLDEMEPKSKTTHRKIQRAALKFNPYIVFNKLIRKKLSQENPYLTNIELSKLVSKAWNSMEETQKAKFVQEQKEKRDEMTELNKKITKKRPTGNGYILYSAEELRKVQQEYPDIKAINDLSSIVGIRWKGLSEEEKEVYKSRARKEKEEWIRDNPEEHQLYLDRMITKIKKTKAANNKKNK